MSTATFLPYKTSFQTIRQSNPKYRKVTAEEYYEAAKKFVDPKYHDSMEEERQWVRCGSPYVKVFPNVARMMMDTSIEIPAGAITYPYPFFAVLFPVELGLPVRSVLTGCVYDGPEIRLSIMAQTQEWWDTNGEHPIEGNALFLPKGELVETHLRSTESNLVPELDLAIWRIVICASFFMLDRHEMVMPDWSRKRFEKWDKAKKRLDTVAMSRFLGMAAEERNLTIGKELELPTPIVEVRDKTQEDEEGTRHLSHSHMRRGHLRMQAYGEKRSQRKLIFVPPQIIRPDLPFKVGGQGYKITDQS